MKYLLLGLGLAAAVGCGKREAAVCDSDVSAITHRTRVGEVEAVTPNFSGAVTKIGLTLKVDTAYLDATMSYSGLHDKYTHDEFVYAANRLKIMKDNDQQIQITGPIVNRQMDIYKISDSNNILLSKYECGAKE